MPLIEIRNLTKIYPHAQSVLGASSRDRGEVRAVDDVSLDIHAGETLGLVGESGSGKSTLGRLILRLIEPTSGRISFEGRDLLGASSGEMRRLRRDMQIIFQDPFASLDPRYRIEDIIAEPLIIHRDLTAVGAPPPPFADFAKSGIPNARRRARVVELLRAVGLDESILRRFPHEFSGGQRQRIGIARALALHPKFIVADEPVSALDVSVGAQIVNLLAQLQRDFGLTYLFISHSMPVVRYLSTRIAVMYRGKIVEVGSSQQITELPQHPYTRSLLEATPEVEV
ncbi:MAG: ATP-binding cassette domain-containing protein [Candidatus Sulfotelmatobacter sp.]|jgi:ABC-type glutathione transport system ATPase component